jgi:hypothetical protein
MKLPKQKPGVLLVFPSGENVTPRPTNESCPECERFEAAYQAAIDQINVIVRGPFMTVREKLTRLFDMQDERDRILAQLYSHKNKVHPRKTA